MIASRNPQLESRPRKSIFSQLSIATILPENKLPTAQEIADCYRYFNASDNIIRHCTKVAEIAVRLGKNALTHDYSVQLDLIEVSAQLHDAARKREHHELEVATYLHQRGHHAIAEIISQHMSARPEFLLINEAAILFLADKLAIENQEVTITERYACAKQKYADNPTILEEINYNIKIAEIIYEKIR